MDFRLLERVVQWILQFVHEPAYNFVLCLKMLLLLLQRHQFVCKSEN